MGRTDYNTLTRSLIYEYIESLMRNIVFNCLKVPPHKILIKEKIINFTGRTPVGTLL